MPAYKEKNKKTWRVAFRYKDWKGEMRSVHKRSFATKHDAAEWENNFKMNLSGNLEMPFPTFVDRYRKDIYPRLKLSTALTKNNIIEKRILPYFENKNVQDITETDILQWQNELISYRDPDTGKPLSKSYLKTIHNQMSSMLNYGVKYFKLAGNNASKVGNMGSENEIEMKFWTPEEYALFAEVMMDFPPAFYCFEVLYWTGIREGELLALTLNDFDFVKKTLTINKTYHRLNGQDIITPPKTRKSYRTIALPDFLVDEVKEYAAMNYGLKSTDRLFPFNKSFLTKHIHAGARDAGVQEIRVHDLRHSHVSLLISMGYSAVAIGKRLGHKSIDITLRYAHLFPTEQNAMAEQLDSIKMAGNY